jgi:hypothetical protein
VLAAVAELERDLILERTTSGKHEALQRGAVYRYDVIGYRYIPSDRKNGQLARIEIDEATAPRRHRWYAVIAPGRLHRAGPRGQHHPPLSFTPSSRHSRRLTLSPHAHRAQLARY